MATENLSALKSIKTSTSFAAKQYYFVKIDASGYITTVSGTGGYAVGVIQDNPASGYPGAVCNPGDITKVYCGGTFAAGDEIMSSSAGKCVAATSGSFVLGTALTAGADGYIATIIYQPKGSKL